MKVYILEIEFFDGTEWQKVIKEITATSMFQLMRTFLNETICIKHETQKELWNDSKEFIEETILTFPIVKTY